jgi:hypothetical protein
MVCLTRPRGTSEFLDEVFRAASGPEFEMMQQVDPEAAARPRKEANPIDNSPTAVAEPVVWSDFGFYGPG